jgi:asparagine synthase (glutamine-hydrolysing)
MCGIAGLVSCGDRSTLVTMTGAIAHRGPDDSGAMWFPESATGLGHRRLSIIDLSSAGHQPMVNDDGRLWIVFNGEIYNFSYIREQLLAHGHQFRSGSDTEVLLKAYEQWGPECLHKLNGMFSFAIFDRQQKLLFAARDRLGIKPLYYSHKKDTLIFASEVKAILASGLVERSPDYDALHTPARYQISPLTGFKAIRKLGPGQCLTFKAGELVLNTYWMLEASEANAGTEAQLSDELDALLNDATRMQMISDVPVGIFLSGGLDSSIIAALARTNTERDMHAFTIKFSNDDQKYEKMPRDNVFACQVARSFGFHYHEFEIKPDISNLLPKVVWHLDEPLSDPAAINLYLMSKAARDLGIVVLLNGMGGDEIFGGYRKYLGCMKAETYQAVFPRGARKLLERAIVNIPVASSHGGWRTLRWAKRFLSFASKPRTERYLSSDLSLSSQQFPALFADRSSYSDTHFYRSQAPVLSGNGISYLTKMCLNDTRVFLPEHNLTYSDKACMAAGIEARPPLTDHRVVEFMFSLPPWARIKRSKQKYLLKKVAERYLPHEIVYRPKAPFAAPLRSWVRGALSEMVDDLLSREVILRRGIYDPDYVASLVARDRAGIEDNSHLIWTLLNVEVWFRTFFQN